MYSEKDIDSIKNIVLSEIDEVESIYLFGSYSNNTAKEDSDIDIAIIMKSILQWKKRKQILNNLYKRTAKMGVIVDFVLKDKLSFYNEKKLPTLCHVIANEGRLIWIKS